MTDRRRPLHAAVLLAGSAAAYAVSLAGMTALQADAERAVAADREPTRVAVDAVAGRNDDLLAELRAIGRAYDRLAADYAHVGDRLAGTEVDLEALAKAVADISGTSRSLPASVPLPKIRSSAGPVVAPPVHATTAASGG